MGDYHAAPYRRAGPTSGGGTQVILGRILETDRAAFQPEPVS